MSVKHFKAIPFILLFAGTIILSGCGESPKSRQLTGKCYTAKTTSIMMVGKTTVPYTEDEKYYLLYKAVYASGKIKEESEEVSKDVYDGHKEFKNQICE